MDRIRLQHPSFEDEFVKLALRFTFGFPHHSFHMGELLRVGQSDEYGCSTPPSGAEPQNAPQWPFGQKTSAFRCLS